ncbi:MAG: bifunctional sulfate adenylyltransferase/adenylylsulfate kinase [Bdellovibrionota bacterium]
MDQDFLIIPELANELKQKTKAWKSLQLKPRQLCDLELILNAGFRPLKSFLSKADYESVCSEMRLATGELWPIPIMLDVSKDFAESLADSESIVLRDIEGVALAILTVSEIWKPDKKLEAKSVYGTSDILHPGVKHLLKDTGEFYLSGKLEGIALPRYHDFNKLRLTPAETKEKFKKLGWDKVVAFQTRNPMHRAHFEITKRAAEEIKGNLLIHPVVGLTKPGDVDYFTRVRCYQSLVGKYTDNSAMLALLPLAMRMAGPRSALWHALIRKNYGCTHFIVGRDHAGPGVDTKGNSFYPPYAAQELLKQHQVEIGIEMLPFKMVSYVESLDSYLPEDEVPEDEKVLSISGSELREKLRNGRKLPEWFTFPEVAVELRRTYRPRSEQGFTVFFTGLPSSGKSTLANVLQTRLLEIGGRAVTLLDGDVVRTHLSSELGFSKEDRDINVKRIGYVASEITKNAGVAICAPIAPYDQVRKDVRAMIAGLGGFILVHVATPLEVCEERDTKGLYEKARAGIVKEFTGISDPYEVPADAELVLDTAELSPAKAVEQILAYLEDLGFINRVGVHLKTIETLSEDVSTLIKDLQSKNSERTVS